jgi:poly(A) polymerase
MTALPDSIAGAAFLGDPAFRRVVEAIAVDGDVALAVGGAVRNTLLGRPVADVDIATSALPETVIDRARRAGLRPVPTGIDHGTVTVVADHVGFEVTTLRSDVSTDGRRATVAFTRDVAEDAGRRDFTMNAIFAGLDGRLIDPTGGIADTLARRVRFIGDASQRIREDYLRILRFFRFHAAFGDGAPDPAGLEACVSLATGLDNLSRERVGQEMRKLVVADGAADTLSLMARTGILSHVLGEAGDPERFRRLAASVRADGHPLDPALAFAALADADAATLTERLRLSKAEKARISEVRDLAGALGADPTERAVRLAVYRSGNAAVLGGLLLAAAGAGVSPSPFADVAAHWTAPRFPVTGRQLIEEGEKPGPELGRRLAALEARWIEETFGREPD